jgi:hypothetical protein
MEIEKRNRELLMDEFRVVRSRFLPFPVDEICRVLLFWFGHIYGQPTDFKTERNSLLYEALRIIVDLIPAKLKTAESRLYELTNSFSTEQRVEFYMLLCSVGYHIEQTRMEIPSDAERAYLSRCIEYYTHFQDQRMLPADIAAVEHNILLTILHNARIGLPRYMWKSFESSSLRLIGIKKTLSDVLESPIKLLDDYLKTTCQKMAEEIMPEKKDIEEEGVPPAPPVPPPIAEKKLSVVPRGGSLTSEELEQQRMALKPGPSVIPDEPSRKSTLGGMLEEGMKRRREAIEPGEEEESAPWTASANTTFFASRINGMAYCSTCFSQTQYRCPVCLCHGQCAECQNSTLHIHLPL